jgi:hypothetical protein
MEPPEAPWAVAPNFPPDAFGRFDTVERHAVLLPVRLVRAKKEPDGDVHLIGSAPTCHWLRPRGSIKAPFSVVW